MAYLIGPVGAVTSNDPTEWSVEMYTVMVPARWHEAMTRAIDMMRCPTGLLVGVNALVVWDEDHQYFPVIVHTASWRVLQEPDLVEQIRFHLHYNALLNVHKDDTRVADLRREAQYGRIKRLYEEHRTHAKEMQKLYDTWKHLQDTNVRSVDLRRDMIDGMIEDGLTDQDWLSQAVHCGDAVLTILSGGDAAWREVLQGYRDRFPEWS